MSQVDRKGEIFVVRPSILGWREKRTNTVAKYNESMRLHFVGKTKLYIRTAIV